LICQPPHEKNKEKENAREREAENDGVLNNQEASVEDIRTAEGFGLY
jgi:hypothetical protein